MALATPKLDFTTARSLNKLECGFTDTSKVRPSKREPKTTPSPQPRVQLTIAIVRPVAPGNTEEMPAIIIVTFIRGAGLFRGKNS
jgi:hypothetical protein